MRCGPPDCTVDEEWICYVKTKLLVDTRSWKTLVDAGVALEMILVCTCQERLIVIKNIPGICLSFPCVFGNSETHLKRGLILTMISLHLSL